MPRQTSSSGACLPLSALFGVVSVRREGKLSQLSLVGLIEALRVKAAVEGSEHKGQDVLTMAYRNALYHHIVNK